MITNEYLGSKFDELCSHFVATKAKVKNSFRQRRVFLNKGDQIREKNPEKEGGQCHERNDALMLMENSAFFS